MTEPSTTCLRCGEDMPDYELHHHLRLYHGDVDIPVVIQFEARFARMWQAIFRGAA